jgi:hypothetical protein
MSGSRRITQIALVQLVFIILLSAHCLNLQSEQSRTVNALAQTLDVLQSQNRNRASMSPSISRYALLIENEYGKLDRYQLLGIEHYLSGITKIYIREYRERGVIITNISTARSVYYYGIN